MIATSQQPNSEGDDHYTQAEVRLITYRTLRAADLAIQLASENGESILLADWAQEEIELEGDRMEIIDALIDPERRDDLARQWSNELRELRGVSPVAGSDSLSR